MDLIVMLFLAFLSVVTIGAASMDEHHFDPRWIAAAFTAPIMIFTLYGAMYLAKIEENLRLLNRLLIGEEDEIRPELKGGMQYLLGRVKEVWKWGQPKL